MGRLSSLLLVAVLCVGVHGDDQDDPWFPDPFLHDSPPPPVDWSPPPPLYPTPNAPSPYYDAPPYDGQPPMDSPPYDPSPPSYSPPDSSPPADGPDPSPWFSCNLWAQKIDSWPSKWSPDTPIGEAFGADAVKVYGQMSMLDGMLSKGDDGYSELLKQGVTALLNTVDKHFKYTEDDVKKCFTLKTALSSEAAATVQAKEFEAANES